MRRADLLETTARGLFHVALLVSVWLTLRGHNAPGGGFAGGLVASAAFVMAYLAEGSEALSRRTRIAPTTLIGSGLSLAAVTGIVSIAAGGAFLESDIATATLPVFGEVKLVTSVVFDLGVYLLVVGVVLSIVTELGREGEQQSEHQIGESAARDDLEGSAS